MMPPSLEPWRAVLYPPEKNLEPSGPGYFLLGTEPKPKLSNKLPKLCCPLNTSINEKSESPSEIAGLMPGDTIYEFNGVKVQNWNELVNLIEMNPRNI